MKTVGLYVGQLYFLPEKMHTWDERNLYEGGIGGAEVWAIEIASRLEQRGYHTIVFADCDNHHFAEDGVEYVPYRDLEKICSSYKFDYFITSRRTDVLRLDIQCENIYLMLHDPFVLYLNSEEDLHIEKIKGIFYQSSFQKRLLQSKYRCMKDELFCKTFQAIDASLYNGVDVAKKKNKMLWSSHKIRGARILIEKILPIIRAEIPDFEIDVCGYADDMTDDYFNAEGVNVLGNITKEELIKRQMESKIWIYPNWGRFEDRRINDETFCITAIENAMARNAIILANKTCFSTTLEGYEGFIGTDLFNGEILDDLFIDEFAKRLAEQAISLLKDEEKRQYLANNAFDICKKYSWDGAVESIINGIEGNANEKVEREELILLSAIKRTENLDIVFDSIINTFPENLNITWALIFDKYNGNGDCNHIIERCKEYQKTNQRFSWLYYPNNERSDEKWGGVMFNDPLKWIKENWMKDKDPWVYILDDDNTLCPLMMEAIVKDMREAKEKGKALIHYDMLYEGGINAPLSELYFGVVVINTDITPNYQATDPSQIVIKYSLLKDMGFYRNVRTYDFEMYWDFVGKYKNRILFSKGTSDDIGLHGYETTHNAIVDKKTKGEWGDIVNNKEGAVCGTLMTATNGKIPQVFHLGREDLKEIYNKYILKADE